MTMLVQKSDSNGSGQKVALNNHKSEASIVADLSKLITDRSMVSKLRQNSKSSPIKVKKKILENELKKVQRSKVRLSPNKLKL